MNILYKYCNISGTTGILTSLELKLPFISEVNDPSDCSPIFFFGDDTAKAKAMWLRAFKSKNIVVFPDTKNILLTEDGKKQIIDGQRQLQENWNRSQGCLLSVSANERNAVMCDLPPSIVPLLKGISTAC